MFLSLSMNVYRLLIIIFLLLPTGGFFAQTQEGQSISQTGSDRDRFSILLEKETATSKDEHDSPSFFTLVPERLPEWINQIPPSSGNNLYLLGISDPGMDEETGLLVAKLRLKTVYALLAGTIVRNMRDFYTSERHASYSNAFIDYTEFSNKISADFSQINIIDSHTTKYGETILLGEIDINTLNVNNSESKLLEVSAGIMSNARRVGSRTEMVSKANLKTTYISDELNEEIELSYKTHAINRRVNTETILNGKPISSLPALSLRYSMESQAAEDSVSIDLTGYSLRNGLWYAYITSIMFELADAAHGQAINISNIHEIFDNMVQNLTREIVSNSVNSRQQQVTIRSNNLYMLYDSAINVQQSNKAEN